MLLALISRTETDLRRLVDNIDLTGRRVLALAGDVSDEGDAETVVPRTEERLGPIAILVNNAGVPGRQLIEVADYTTEEFDRILGVNLRSAFF